MDVPLLPATRPVAMPPHTKAAEPVMYLVVNTSLGMTAGKIGAQCAHAAVLLALRAAADEVFVPVRDARGYIAARPDPVPATETSGPAADWREWLTSSFKKIVLGADEATCLALADLPGAVAVRDAGHTQVAAGSLTVVGFPPAPRGMAPPTVRALSTL